MDKLFCLFCVFIINYSVFSGSNNKNFKFIDPLPDAKYVNKETAIIIKPSGLIDKTSLVKANSVVITGSISGIYGYSAIESRDGETIILKPVENFKSGEKIKVEFTTGIKTSEGNGIQPFSYTFNISERTVKVNRQYNILSELSDKELSRLPFGYNNFDMIRSVPEINVNYSNNPAPGRILMTNFSLFPPFTPYLIILNNDATVFYDIQMPAPCFDFNLHPNGNLTFFDGYSGKYYEMDMYYDIVDSYFCGNGYGTDLHELRVLSNKHALLMSYDSQHVDMSQIVPGGNPNAVVSGLIIQEIDEAKNVVFQWRSWDHFQITDAWHEDMLAASIDAVHGNAIELDNDGNIMISSRHLDEITKINRTTGEVMWRFGGKNNQFTFTGDTMKFTYQHAIRRLKNGNIILYDNGNFHSPQFSRAVEYSLDEQNKIANTVWQYCNSPVTYAGAMGFAQRLDNGNTFISWGFAVPTLTEVKYDGTKAFELSYPFGTFSYRTFKYVYKENESQAQFAPQSIFLRQNYPNPFNPKTTISFGIPRINDNRGFVNVLLKVYDALGREIAILVDEPLKPYTYNFEFDGTNFASGIYFYTLYVSGGEAKYYETKKMVLVK